MVCPTTCRPHISPSPHAHTHTCQLVYVSAASKHFISPASHQRSLAKKRLLDRAEAELQRMEHLRRLYEVEGVCGRWSHSRLSVVKCAQCPVPLEGACTEQLLWVGMQTSCFGVGFDGIGCSSCSGLPCSTVLRDWMASHLLRPCPVGPSASFGRFSSRASAQTSASHFSRAQEHCCRVT